MKLYICELFITILNNRFMKNIYLFLLILVGLNAFSQKGTLKGKISDYAGKPASHVNAQIKNSSKGVQTNDNGEFEINNIDTKIPTVIVSCVGFKTLEHEVELTNNKVNFLELQLSENEDTIKEIIVKGSKNANNKSVSLGKMSIKAMDLPQSIAIIDSKTIENQQIKTISDVLANTNGVYIMGTTGGYQEEIAGRGFSFGSSNTFRNRVRFFNGIPSDLSNIEKVEIMKGSTAILYGNVAAGGIINLVTKKPMAEFGGEISFKTGSFNLLKPYLDIHGGVDKNKNLSYRLNTSFEKANGFRVGVSSKSYYVNPSLMYKLGKSTEILVETNFANDERTPDFGAGIINYEVVDLPRELFTGIRWSTFKAKQSSINLNIAHSLSANWKLNLVASKRNYATELFANTRPNSSGNLIKSDGKWIRNVQKTNVKDEYLLAQVDLNGKFNIGSISNQILVGIETDKFNTETTNYLPVVKYDSINIFQPELFIPRNDKPNMNVDKITTAPIHRMGVYVQNLMSITEYIKLLAGIRYSYQETTSDVFTKATNKNAVTKNYDAAFTPRLGLVIQPNKNISLFGSYSNSFTVNTGVDTAGKALKPSLIDQYEIGFKNQIWKNKLALNVTLYKIINSNLAQTSLDKGNTNTNIKELAGEVSSKGVEIDVNFNPINALTISTGYSFNETKYTKSNSYIINSLLRYNPKHTANFSANYTLQKGLLNGLKIGLIGLYIGERQAGRSFRTTQPNDSYKLIPLKAYTQIDGTIAYSYKKINLGAKIGNIFDTQGINVHDDNSVNYITPRNFTTSIAYKF